MYGGFGVTVATLVVALMSLTKVNKMAKEVDTMHTRLINIQKKLGA